MKIRRYVVAFCLLLTGCPSEKMDPPPLAPTPPISAPAAPSIPTGLTATAGDSQVTLAWNINPAGEDVTFYNLYIALTSEVTKTNYQRYTNVTSPYIYTGLNGTTYYFVITATNDRGESVESSPVSATPAPPPPPPPSAPTGLNATAMSESQIKLLWVDHSLNENGFKVERGVDGVHFTEIATVDANTTSYNDAGLTVAVTYYYRVRAFNGEGHSEYSDAVSAVPSSFVTVSGTHFMRNGNRHFFSGTNNYYIVYKSNSMVDELLTTASGNNLKVIRTWGFIDIGNQDSSHSIDGKKDDIYFHYWDGTSPAFNDGAYGLQKLDYVIWKAGQLGIRLVIPFVNNWKEFGGMDQYVRWKGGSFHDEFYSDTTIKQWYKEYVAHLLNRVNPLTGLAYKDDPTIMAWELANEPRCSGSGVAQGGYPPSSSCNAALVTEWVSEMSAYVKGIDTHHLVAVGDEGFYCIAGLSDWTENCSEGVDTVALANVATVDFIGFHLYPDFWGQTPDWGTNWIIRHVNDGHNIGKPVLLGEFGISTRGQYVSQRDSIYTSWTKTILDNNASDLFWMLATSGYPDYDGFTIDCPSSTCTLLNDHAQQMQSKVGNNSSAQFADEFNDSTLDQSKWDLFKGHPTIGNGELMLTGETTRSDIQSKPIFSSGILTIAVESSHWKPQTEITDASFGLEIFTGANGNCHYGLLFVANGNMGLLKPEPDANNNCSGDPTFQEYQSIPDWDAIRAGNKLLLTFNWSVTGVTLHVSDSGSGRSALLSSIQSAALPNVPLKIRLNADFNETYFIDYVRFAGEAP